VMTLLWSLWFGTGYARIGTGQSNGDKKGKEKDRERKTKTWDKLDQPRLG